MADTANGMGGLVVPAVFEPLNIDLEIMYGELDGTFPNHPADPIQPENTEDLRRVVEVGADIGLARRRCRSRSWSTRPVVLSGSTTTAIIAAASPRAEPGRDRDPQPDLLQGSARGVREHGGTPVRTCGSLVHQGRRWPRPVPSSVASTLRTTTSGDVTTGPIFGGSSRGPWS
ncbi:MAG: hypothetical protein R2789_09040 [Microthrixaceae bacterium]